MNIIDYITAFENGELDESGVIDMFQYLIDTGMINSLQGSYQRVASRLIEAGYILLPNGDN